MTRSNITCTFPSISSVRCADSVGKLRRHQRSLEKAAPHHSVVREKLITVAVAILAFLIRHTITYHDNTHDYASFKPFDRWKKE